MVKRIKIAGGYRNRAKEELEASQLMLESHFYVAAISRAYYAVYYAITASLVEMDIFPKSHKQTAIEFRKRFIKTCQFDKKYSEILDELFNARMISDYDAIPEIDEKRTKHLLALANEFVREMLK